MKMLALSRRCCVLITTLLISAAFAVPADTRPETITVEQFVLAVQHKAELLRDSKGMRQGFQTFTSAHGLKPETVSYSDYVLARLLFEATRDAGFWNLHWAITNQEPNSDKVWQQWKTVQNPSPLTATATAECDELSALYAFLVGRAGVKGMGLFWPYPNHTVAVWVLHPSHGNDVRVVVPTTQIFLSENDFFGTKAFNAWKQKSVFQYRRRDVPDTFDIPKPLATFFLHQIDQYAGATNTALQRIRYLREAVFLKSITPERAAEIALKLHNQAGETLEDANAYWNFAQDMKGGRRKDAF